MAAISAIEREKSLFLRDFFLCKEWRERSPVKLARRTQAIRLMWRKFSGLSACRETNLHVQTRDEMQKNENADRWDRPMPCCVGPSR